MGRFANNNGTNPILSHRDSNESVIWGLTGKGVKIYSNDFGKTWFKGDYTEEEKEQFREAHINPVGSGEIRGNDHSPPDGWFRGVSPDKWWFTQSELCVSSPRLASKVMTYCVKWWCECADLAQNDQV